MSNDQHYSADLAYIHDAGFTDFARSAGQGILQLFKEHRIDGGLVVDLGCGSGVWAAMLVDAGYSVHGIDISKHMIDMCRHRVPKGSFEVNSFLQAELPTASVVTSIGECLNYLFDTQNNLSTLHQLFSRVYTALKKGGLFVFDVISPGYAKATGPPRRHKLAKNWAVLVEIDEDAANQTLTRSITTFTRFGDSYRRDEEIHRVQLYRGEDLKKILESVGFQVNLSYGYPDFNLRPAHAVLVARKA